VVLALGFYVFTQPLGSLFGSAGSRSPDASGMARGGTGGPAPDFVNADGSSALLVGLDDRSIRIADFAGRPLWIVFWATWCIPCQEEAAHIQAAYQAHEPDRLAVLAIDVQEPTAAVRDYVATHGISYAIGLDPTAAVMALYGARGLPSHVFVDREGVMRDRYAGQLTAATMEEHLGSILGR
jgi:thiol-disulfide isomerase/thioredoxin